MPSAAAKRGLRGAAAEPSQPSQPVHSVFEAFGWARYVLNRAAALRKQQLEDIPQCWRYLRLSTAFSGIGAPEFACHTISCHLVGLLNLAEADQYHGRPHDAIERDNLARLELLSHARPPDHIFVDITEFLLQDPSAIVHVCRWTQSTWSLRTSLRLTLSKLGLALVFTVLAAAALTALQRPL